MQVLPQGLPVTQWRPEAALDEVSAESAFEEISEEPPLAEGSAGVGTDRGVGAGILTNDSSVPPPNTNTAATNMKAILEDRLAASS